MKGWFDAFRNDGGPTLYSHSNRTPVTGDVQTVAFAAVFCTIFLAFLIIFPGVRKERFSTFMSVTLSLFVGSVILVSKSGSGWHVACSDIVSSYRAFSREKISAELGAYVGLGHVNVTLTVPPSAVAHNGSSGAAAEDVDFNERFHWAGPGEMQDTYRAALERGLPFPILTVAEILNMDQEGFSWGRQYREAGYYAGILLWASFSTWLLMNLLLVVVPRYGAYTMALTGMLLLCADLAYYSLLPDAPLVLRFETGLLHFRLGWCFWLVLGAGSLCALVGITISAVDLVFPHHFSTILEVDYDTPYDRHVIIEDSRHRGRKKKSGSVSTVNNAPGTIKTTSLEDPPGAGQWGSKLLRRLSKRDKIDGHQGVENNAFEMDPPKSPWSYPHMMQHHRPQPPGQGTQHRGLERAPVARFTAADVARQRLEDRRLVSGGVRRVPITRAGVVSMAAFRRSDSQESTSSSGSAATSSSFGLGFLRGSSHRPGPVVPVATHHRDMTPQPSRLSLQ